MAKRNKPNKYYLDSSKFFELLKSKNVSWLQLSNYSDVNQSVIAHVASNSNVHINTIIKLIEGLEEILECSIENKNELFGLKEVKKKK